MIITCPSCYTNFEANDALIPLDGRNLQCSKCKHKWFFKPANYTHANPQTSVDALNKKESPKIVANKDTTKQKLNNAGVLLYPTISLVLCFALVVLFAKPYLINVIGFKQFYHLIAYDDTRALQINKVNITPLIKANSEKYLIITGEINNNSNHEITSPYLRIELYDKTNKLLMQEILPYSASNVITPGQVLPINYPMRLFVPLETIHRVELDIADNLDFLFNLR